MYNVLIIDQSKNTYSKLDGLRSDTISGLFYSNTVQSVTSVMKSVKIDIIISDITLGNEDIFPFLESIRINYRFIPILILTSNHNKEKVLKAVSIGTMGYFLKPMDEKLLLMKIKSAMEAFNKHHPNRNFVRIHPLKNDVVELKFSNNKSGGIISANLIDISLGGMAFNQSTDNYIGNISQNETLALTLKLNEYSFNLTCEVVSTEGLRCNVKFGQLSKLYQEILSNYIYKRIGSEN